MSELRRRLVHASGAGLPLCYLLGAVTWRTFGRLLVALAAVAVALEGLRLTVGLDWAIYDHLTREYEQDNPAGYALYAVSTTAVALAFDPAVAVPGMLMLMVGDPISGLLSSAGAATEGKRPGVLAAMFSVCFALAAPFALDVASPPVAVAAAAVGAAGATAADGLKPVVAGYVVDDNLSIPPAACAGMWLVLRLFG
ncbi:MAG: dolichol kinase [Haloferacaceae archaeon]